MAGQLNSNAMMKRQNMNGTRRELSFTLQPRLSNKDRSFCFESMLSSSSSTSVELITSPKKRLSTPISISMTMMKLPTPTTKNLSSSSTTEKRYIDSMTLPPQCVFSGAPNENALPKAATASRFVLLPRTRNQKNETKIHSTDATVNTTSSMKTKAIGVLPPVPKLPSSRKTAFSTFRKQTSSGTAALPMTELMNQFPELKNDPATGFFLTDPTTVFGPKKTNPSKNRLYGNDHPNLYFDPKEDDDHENCYYRTNTSTTATKNFKHDAPIASAFAPISGIADPCGPSRSIPFIDFIPIREEDTTISSSNGTTRSRSASFTESMSEEVDSEDFTMNDNVCINDTLDDKGGKLGLVERYYDNEQDMEDVCAATLATPTGTATAATPTPTATGPPTSPNLQELQVNLNEQTNRSFSTLSITSLSCSSSSSSLMNIDDLFSSQVVEEKNKDEEQCHHDVMLRGMSSSMLPFRPIHKTALMNLEENSPFDYPSIEHNGYSSPRFNNIKDKDTTMISLNEVFQTQVDTNHLNGTSPSLLNTKKSPPFKKRRVLLGVDNITYATDTTASSTTCTKKIVHKEDAITNMTMTFVSSYSPLPSRSLSSNKQLSAHTSGLDNIDDYFESDPIFKDKEGNVNDHVNNHVNDHHLACNNNNSTLHVPTPVYANKSMSAQELYNRNIRLAFESFNTEHVSPSTIIVPTQAHCTTPSRPEFTLSPKKTTNCIKNQNNSTKVDDNDDDYDMLLCTEKIINDDDSVLELDSIEIDQECVLGPPTLHRHKIRNNILFQKN